MKKALVVIAPEDFQDYEYSATVDELRKAKIEVITVSTKNGVCIGRDGSEVEAIGPDEIKMDEFDAIILIGGGGVPILRNDERFVVLTGKFADSGKIVAAICWAPVILAKAGVLKGKKATVWVGNDPEYGKGTDKVLEQYGAIFVDNDVVEDANIVTANGSAASKEFGEKIVEKLLK